jgi:hypothetical protein
MAETLELDFSPVAAEVSMKVCKLLIASALWLAGVTVAVHAHSRPETRRYRN